jgi:hypothetical protein
MEWPRERHGRSSAITHRAQISRVFRLIVLAATRSQYGCCRLHSCEVSTLEHRPKKFLDHVRDAIRLKHDSIRTEEFSVTWIKRSILFHNTRHPNEMASAEIEAFLTHLAVAQQVVASTQNQALSVLRCLSCHVLKTPLDFPIDAVCAKKPTRAPTVTPRFMAKLLSGGGLGLMECRR